MIHLSEAFGMIGNGQCCDVATSLALQGTNTAVSIPLYEIFFLKILPGEGTQFLVSSIPEYNIIRHLASSCGAVAATINLLDLDILTLVGTLLIYTPSSGMTVFTKLGDIVTEGIDEDMVNSLANLAGIPIPSFIPDLYSFAGELLETLYNRLVDMLSADLEQYNINLIQWDMLPDFYEELRDSGEMAQMAKIRQMVGAFTL